MTPDGCHPRGRIGVSRGGGTNSPAAVYATTKYIDWLKKYAPPGSVGHDASAKPALCPRKGKIAQQMFWYTAFTASMLEARQRDEPRRHAEVAHGAVAARRVLEGRHAERLSGRRLVDLLQVHAGQSARRRMAVCAVRDVEERCR